MVDERIDWITLEYSLTIENKQKSYEPRSFIPPAEPIGPVFSDDEADFAQEPPAAAPLASFRSSFSHGTSVFAGNDFYGPEFASQPTTEKTRNARPGRSVAIHVDHY